MALQEVAVHHPLAMFTPGIPVEMGNLSILFDSRDEDGNLYDIQIYEFDSKGSIRRDLTASRGKVEVVPGSQLMNIILYDATVSSREDDSDDKNVHFFSEEFKFALEFGK